MPSSSRTTTKKAIVMFATAAHLIGRRYGVCAFRAAAASRLSHLGVPSSSHIAVGQANNLHTSSYFSSPSSSLITTRIKAEQSNNNGDNNDVEPTWTYTPYNKSPPKRKQPPPRRRFSTSPSEDPFIVPAHIPIPEDQLTVSFARASGAGGQNVNKVNTKVELRFHLDTATWIPSEVRQRLKSNEAFRINKENWMTVTSQEHRTQGRNREDAIKKLRDILKGSWPRPKVRKMRKGLTKKAKEHRRENKKKVSMKKESRGRVSFD